MKEYYDNDLLNQIKYLIETGKENLAIKKINEYKERYPNDKAVEIYNVKLLISKREFEAGESLCLELLKHKYHADSIYHNILYCLGEIYQFSQRIDKAIEVFKELDNITRHSMPQAIIKLSIIYIDNKRIEEAKKLLSKRYNFSYDPRIEIKKAEICVIEKNFEKALDIINSLIDNNIKDKVYFQQKNIFTSKCYRKLNKIDKAIEYASNALTTKNRFYWIAYYEIAKIYSQQGDYNKASDMCVTIRENIKYSQATYLLLSIYLKKHDYENFNIVFKELKDEKIKKSFLGQLNIQLNNYEKAEELLKETMQFNTYSHHTKYYYLIVLFKLKKYKEVLEMINTLDINEYRYFTGAKNDIVRMRMYCRIALGIDSNETSYLKKQIYNYSIEEAIKHISIQHKFQLNKNIDLNDLFEFATNNISINNKMDYNAFDAYIIDYPIVLENNNTIHEIIKVICLPETNNIITLYPIEQDELLINNDFNIKKEEGSKKKVKRLSQIEKFNKKYNL